MGRGRRVATVSGAAVTLPAHGELWWCQTAGHGRRPVVVLSRDAAIAHLRRVLVAPCTTTVRGLASEVVLVPGDDPVPLRAAVNLDLVESVPVEALGARLGRLADARMRAVRAALAVAVGWRWLPASSACCGLGCVARR